MKALAKSTAFFDRLIEVLAAVAAVLCIGLMVIVCIGVGMRYLFNQPIAGIAEISEYLLLFITFISAAWILREDGHVRIDIMLELLSPRGKIIANLITSILCALACVILVWFGTKITAEHFTANLRLTTYLMPPSYIILAVIPFAYALLFIQFLRIIRHPFKSSAPKASKPEKTESPTEKYVEY